MCVIYYGYQASVIPYNTQYFDAVKINLKIKKLRSIGGSIDLYI